MRRCILLLIAELCCIISVKGQSQMQVNLVDGLSMEINCSDIDSITWDDVADNFGYNYRNNPYLTCEVTDITENSATLKGSFHNARIINSTGLEMGIIYSMNGEPNFYHDTTETVFDVNHIISMAKADGEYTINLTKLKPGTTYYYRTYVWCVGFVFYGKVRSFKTLPLDTHTYSARDITGFSAD